MRLPNRSFVTIALAAPLLALLNQCEPAPERPPTENIIQTRESSGGSSSGSARRARTDIHCTPQNDGDEAACRARGEQYAFGPPPHGHGTEPPPDVLEAEQRAYAQGTEACVCMTQQERMQALMVP